MLTDTTPVWGDSDNVLLQKICQAASQAFAAGEHPPEPMDSDNNLLFKIAHIFNGS